MPRTDRATDPRRPAGRTSRPASSTQEIQKVLLSRIAAGIHGPGDRLPSCPALAQELGANKNTVSKAYRALTELGYLDSQPGRGTYVVERPPARDRETAATLIGGLLDLAVQEARLTGMTAEEVRGLVDGALARFFGRVVTVGLIDHNRPDAVMLSRALQASLGHPVEPVLLDDIVEAPGSFADRFDILAVDLGHMVAVEETLGSASRTEVVGLTLVPDPESLTRIARLAAGTRVGIVHDVTSTLLTYQGLIANLNGSLRVAAAPLDDENALRDMLGRVDVAVAPALAERRIAELAPDLTLMVIAWSVAHESARRVAERLTALTLAGTSTSIFGGRPAHRRRSHERAG